MNIDNTALDNCIKCTTCVSHCPVAGVTEKFPGPKQVGPDLFRLRILGLPAYHPALDFCTNCKRCDVACPSGVKISTMNVLAREEMLSQNGLPLRDRMLARPDWSGKLGGMAPALVNLASGISLLRKIAGAITGISPDMTMPRYAGKGFYSLSKKRKSKPSPNRAVYFPGCYVNYYSPETGLAVLNVLEKCGVEVLPARFGCCGLPLVSSGQLATARKVADRNIRLLQNYIKQGCIVITSCPSCSLALRQEYREVLGAGDDYRPEGNILDIFEYLLFRIPEKKLAAQLFPLAGHAGYHQPCHTRAMGLGSPSLEVLGMIPELRVTPLDAGCCGLSGSYGFKREKYPVSMEIGQNLFRAARELGTGRIITECGMCQLQIRHGTGLDTCHPVQLLAASYRGG
ncbi:MAG: anaerobic glycerol-3-phosphate dehydrogenase subunit C [Bacillota bacterium]